MKIDTSMALFSCTCNAAIIADYGGEFGSTGWSYLWNSTSSIGTATNYQTLTVVGNTPAAIAFHGSEVLGVLAQYNVASEPAQFLRLNQNGTHPWASSGIAAITGYTVMPRKEGIMSLVNTNASREGQFGADGTFLSVWVNDTQIGSTVEVPKASDASTPGVATFNQSLGFVNVGGTIYVAVESGVNQGQDGIFFDFRSIRFLSRLHCSLVLLRYVVTRLAVVVR